MKRFLSLILVFCLLMTPVYAIETLQEDAITISAPYALLMEQSTGTVIYEKGAHERCSPASVTKVMTMLLVMEAMEDGILGEDTMIIASEKAASMGGSQIWLEAGERMSAGEMLKCVAVVSANDCAVALAEQISGTEEAFVQQMNRRAAELGMEDTNFTNCTGLHDDDNHYTSAYDIALMSRELLRHEKILEYTTIWMDTIRKGEFGLSNTNKLIYYYDGANGLKTGFTTKAMYCLAASAEREGVEYIAVVLHAETSSDRFESAKTLLSYGFANYALLSLRPPEALPPVEVQLGREGSIQPVYAGAEYLLEEKGRVSSLTFETELPGSVAAPVSAGQVLGTLTVRDGGEILTQIDIVSAVTVEKMSFWDVFRCQFCAFLGKTL